MGILPLQFKEGMNRKKLNLIGSELITVKNIEKGLQPGEDVMLRLSMQTE
jgi:aconitate hydratase